jgi:regulator of PEP synthase PpsR (kinase-PPPase family)
MPVEHVHPLVRTQKQSDRVLGEIDEAPRIAVYMLLEEDLVERLETKCRELGLAFLSILGPNAPSVPGLWCATYPQCRMFSVNRCV